MQTVTIRDKTGADGVLRLTVPVGVADAECEVVVVIQQPVGGGWLPDFFARMAHGWQGERLERPPQGEYEVREPWR